MKYEKAADIKKRIDKLIKILNLKYIKPKYIHCIRSFDAKTRAYARIWGMAKIFKEVAGLEPHYIIEVNSKRFDRLSDREQLETMVHELMHIPKTFSGALLSHRGKGRRINHSEIQKILRSKNI